MTDQHPITPPPELIQKWIDLINYYSPFWKQQLIVNAYQAGADQELEACVNFVYDNELCDPNFYNNLRTARRPEPPSLKEQALTALSHLLSGSAQTLDTTEAEFYIRRALEALPND
jgi:hypothetical protein